MMTIFWISVAILIISFLGHPISLDYQMVPLRWILAAIFILSVQGFFWFEPHILKWICLISAGFSIIAFEQEGLDPDDWNFDWLDELFK